MTVSSFVLVKSCHKIIRRDGVLFWGGPGVSDPAAIDPEDEEEQVMGNWIVLASRAFQHGRRDLNN